MSSLGSMCIVRPDPMALNFTAVVEQCKETGLYVGYVPGLTGAHSQAKTLGELNKNLQEVIATLMEDGMPEQERLSG